MPPSQLQVAQNVERLEYLYANASGACLDHGLYAMLDLSSLEELITQVVTIDFSQSSEQATREMAVNPIIGALGWNTMKPDEVAREFSVRGGKVDYCLRGQMRNWPHRIVCT